MPCFRTSPRSPTWNQINTLGIWFKTHMESRSDNQDNTRKSRIHQKIRFLEDQLMSLDHFLPETYDYLMQELDLQRRHLAELEVTEIFDEIDRDQCSDSKRSWILNYRVLLLLKKKSRIYQFSSRPLLKPWIRSHQIPISNTWSQTILSTTEQQKTLNRLLLNAVPSRTRCMTPPTGLPQGTGSVVMNQANPERLNTSRSLLMPLESRSSGMPVNDWRERTQCPLSKARSYLMSLWGKQGPINSLVRNPRLDAKTLMNWRISTTLPMLLSSRSGQYLWMTYCGPVKVTHLQSVSIVWAQIWISSLWRPNSGGCPAVPNR